MLLQVLGLGATTTEVGIPTSFAIQLADEHGNAVTNPAADIISGQLLPLTDVAAPLVITMSAAETDGTLLASYKATTAGIYALQLTVNGTILAGGWHFH